MFHDRFGNLKRSFKVDILGILDSDTLTLDEKFVYDDGEKDTRIWTDDGYMKRKLMEFLETDWEADAKFLKEEVDNMEKKSFTTFLSETKDIEESQELQALMALDDAGIEAVIDKKGRIVVKKKDIKVINPANSKSCAIISLGSKEDIIDAVTAAK